MLLLLVLLVPAALLGGAAALGARIPVPEIGRDYVLRLVLRDEASQFDLPEILGPDDPARPLVVIDAGHGGRDPGAIGEDADGKRFAEKDITLAHGHGLAR
jgi:N-acetylmuramoyl-L-alanine amidase